MPRLIFTFLSFLFFGSIGFTQDLSSSTKISLITCGSGDDLYSTFGHSAIHVQDPVNGIDRVYNYGTFDFNTPNFYLKFAQGKLEYILNVTSLERFIWSYQADDRWVYRQELNLDLSQIERIYIFLETNALPENRAYKYDFFYDNCSTRLRDVLEEVLGDDLIYPYESDSSDVTFRDLIDLYVPNHPWSDLGIDLALGMPCDRIANKRNQMFLPDYLMENIGNSKVLVNGKPKNLVLKDGYILQGKDRKGVAKSILWIFWVLFIIIGLSSVFLNPLKLRWIDILLFTTIGILGICILLLWFATDHSATKMNLNILWATPTWLYGTYAVLRRQRSQKFFKTHAIAMFAIVVFWIFIPQNFHAVAIPIILTLGVRAWSWQKFSFSLKKSSK